MRVLVREEIVDLVIEHLANEMDLPFISVEEKDALKDFVIKVIAFYLYELKEKSDNNDEIKKLQ
jgi:hypothetical protein